MSRPDMSFGTQNHAGRFTEFMLVFIKTLPRFTMKEMLTNYYDYYVFRLLHLRIFKFCRVETSTAWSRTMDAPEPLFIRAMHVVFNLNPTTSGNERSITN